MVCGESFYVCDDATDEEEHVCIKESGHSGKHKCKCGVTGDC